MKTNKPHHFITYSSVAVFSALAIALLKCYSSDLYPFFAIGWVALALTLIMLFLPSSYKATLKKTYSTGQWLLQIAAFQLSLFAMYLGVSWVSNMTISSFNTLPKPLFTLTSFDLLAHFGLFPWGIALVIAFLFIKLSNIKQTDIYFSNLLAPNTASNHIGWRSTNAAIKYGLGLAILSCIFFITLLWALVFAPDLFPIRVGATVSNMFIPLALFAVTFSKFFKQTLKKLLAYKNPTSLGICIATLGTSIILILLNIVFSFLPHSPVALPAFIQNFMKQGVMPLWNLFSACWWLSWGFIAGLFIARISRGYSTAQIFMATLTLPLLLLLSCYLILHNNIITTQFYLSTTYSYLTPLIATLGFIGLITLTMRKIFLPCMILSYLPLSITKHRNHHFMFRKYFQACAILLYFYLATNLASLTPLFLFFGIILYATLVWVLISAFRILIR